MKHAVRALAISTLALLATTVAPAAAGAAPPAWGACPPLGDVDPRQQCAQIAVPLDYAAPGGATIEIAVSRIPAENPAARRGVLVFNPGGPGEGGLDGPTILAETLPQQVRERYDLIGFDPRGVAYSAPVTCGLAPEDLDVLRFIPYPDADGDIAENVAYAQRAATGCAANGGPALPHMTTANTARDMDQLRGALGERKLNYIGYSYGTYLGAVYATLFPERTDRFVLDSIVHPDAAWRDAFDVWGPAAETAFPGFARYAADRDATYGLGATPEAVRATFFELLHELEAEPFDLGGFVIDHRMLRELLRSALRSERSFPELAFIWQLIDARQGPIAVNGTSIGAARAAAEELLRETTPAAPPAGARTAAAAAFPTPADDNGFASPWAVVCGEADWPEDPAFYQQEVLLDTQLFPLAGPAAANIWPCAFWPSEPHAPLVEIGELQDGRALLVQSERDPATPHGGGVAMRERLGGGARLVTVGNGGHSIAYRGKNACADAATTRFLTDGTLPAQDLACTAEPAWPAPAAE